MHPIVHLSALMARQHGVVSRSQAIEAGLTENQIDSYLKTGQLVAVHPGVYRHPATPVSDALLDMAAVVATRPDGALSHFSAAHRRGFARRPEHVYVVTRFQTRRDLCGVYVARSRRRPDIPTDLVDGIPTIAAAYALLTCAHALQRRPRSLSRLTDRAVRIGCVDREELGDICRQWRGHPGSTALRNAVARQPSGIERHATRVETELASIVEHHWPGRFLPQYPIETDVRAFAADFADPTLRIVLEADGPHHRDAEQAEYDREVRNPAIRRAGWHLEVVSSRRIEENPESVVRIVDTLLADRGVSHSRHQ